MMRSRRFQFQVAVLLASLAFILAILGAYAYVGMGYAQGLPGDRRKFAAIAAQGAGAGGHTPLHPEAPTSRARPVRRRSVSLPSEVKGAATRAAGGWIAGWGVPDTPQSVHPLRGYPHNPQSAPVGPARVPG